MVTSRKMLIAFDPSRPKTTSGDFLTVVIEDDRPQFLGLKSGTFSELGTMVYVGMDVSDSDVFARLVETGRKIHDVERTISIIQSYIRLLQAFRIGDILAIEDDPSQQEGFRLRKTGVNLPKVVKRLPG